MSSLAPPYAILLHAWRRYSLHYTSVGSAHGAGTAAAWFQWKGRGPGADPFSLDSPPSGAGHSWLTVKEVDDPSISTEKHEKARFPMLLGIGCNRSPPPWCCGWKNGEFELTRPDNSELSLQWKSGGEQLVI
jgi:hypothetical protein